MSLSPIETRLAAHRYMRGRGATRFGVRPMDLQHDLSSLMYWRDVAFYAGQDKYHNLKMYCKHAIQTLNEGARVQLEWNASHTEVISARTTIQLELSICGLQRLVNVHGGGDAASGSAEGGREGPAGKFGCCPYCTLRKVSDTRGQPSPWFDRAACDSCEIRTCWTDTCRAHERPPGCPVGYNPSCPSCGFKCSLENIKKSREAREEMSASGLVKHDRERRRTHAGVEEHQAKAVHLDHIYRQFSALHLLLNGCGTNISVTLAAGAPPSVLKKLNAELGKPEYNLFWRMREEKSGRDVRPNGPECRKLLFTPGLIHKLLCIRYQSKGSNASSSANLAQLQRQGSHLNSSRGGTARDGATTNRPGPPAQAPTNKRAQLAPTSSRNINPSALLTALGGLGARPQAPTVPTPTPIAAVVAVANDVDETEEYEEGEQEVADDDETFDVPSEVLDDFDSAVQVWSTFIQLILELHDDWNDHDLTERQRRAALAADKGAAWTTCVRRHSNYTCNHLYNHIAFAHLKDLIMMNGHPFCGDDAVLERGHRVSKKLRQITSGGGAPRAKNKFMQSVRQKRIGPNQVVAKTVTARIRPTREEQLGKLIRVLAKCREERPTLQISATALATQVRLAKAKKEVKAESAQRLLLK